ncbi:MAG: hypothetical protein LBI14_03945, partial [Treponema sp.]|nr:hypothetical protein [Treponema sp.]
MKRRKYFGLLFFAIVLVIGSCSTIPKNTAQVSSGGDFSLLPTGGQLYLWADVNEARVLLESINFNGISLNQAAAIIDRT